MFVHLGRGCVIESLTVIGIFSIKNNNDFYQHLKDKNGNPYEIEDLSEKGMADSVILTNSKIYLSAISSLTLQKRINANLIYYGGGNND